MLVCSFGARTFLGRSGAACGPDHWPRSLSTTITTAGVRFLWPRQGLECFPELCNPRCRNVQRAACFRRGVGVSMCSGISQLCRCLDVHCHLAAASICIVICLNVEKKFKASAVMRLLHSEGPLLYCARHGRVGGTQWTNVQRSGSSCVVCSAGAFGKMWHAMSTAFRDRGWRQFCLLSRLAGMGTIQNCRHARAHWLKGMGNHRIL